MGGRWVEGGGQGGGGGGCVKADDGCWFHTTLLLKCREEGEATHTTHLSRRGCRHSAASGLIRIITFICLAEFIKEMHLTVLYCQRVTSNYIIRHQKNIKRMLKAM